MSNKQRELIKGEITREISKKDYLVAANVAVYHGMRMVAFAIEKAYQMGMLHGEDEAMDRYSHVYGDLGDEDDV